MKIIGYTGKSDVAVVYIAEFESGKQVEFTESVQPPYNKEKKWVLIISTLFGCPVKCRICDAGLEYRGKLNYNELLSQIDFLVTK